MGINMVNAIPLFAGLLGLFFAILAYSDYENTVTEEEIKSMNDFYKLLELIPDSIKCDILDFENVRLKDGKDGFRVTMDRLLTESEKQALSHKARNRLLGVDCVAHYKYAPEIQKSYFYLVF